MYEQCIFMPLKTDLNDGLRTRSRRGSSLLVIRASDGDSSVALSDRIFDEERAMRW